MSVQQPYEIPYPNLPAEQMQRPYEPPPVGAVTGAAASRSVEQEAERSTDNSAQTDMATISNTIRIWLQNAARIARERAEREAANEASFAEMALTNENGIRNNPAIRELLVSFQNYDNSPAVQSYDQYLSMFTGYNPAYGPPTENDLLAAAQVLENEDYFNFGITRADNETREQREGISIAIDRWFVGEGVFSPLMLHHSSSDGFRFTPLSQASRMALRAADVLASYERTRIANYLREMANLTPNDFMFYDPTGLGSLALRDRREFLAQVDRLLTQADIEARASELRYQISGDAITGVEIMDLESEQMRARIRELVEQINTYYGQLMNSIRHYGMGVVSDSMA